MSLLHQVGSAPVLPTTTTAPRAKAFNRIRIKQQHHESGYQVKQSEKEKKMMIRNINALRTETESLKRENDLLKSQVTDLKAQLVVNTKCAVFASDKISKSYSRYSAMIEAVASIDVGAISNKDLKKIELHNKGKIDWGGTDHEAFKKALVALSRERNEVLKRAQAAERRVISLEQTNDLLEKIIRESGNNQKTGFTV